MKIVFGKKGVSIDDHKERINLIIYKENKVFSFL